MPADATSPRPLRLGHRGARRSAPENSLRAFDLALTHGCDGFEFDVRLTADQRAVICHDPECGGLAVAACRYNELATQNPELALLNDVLFRYATRAYLDIELKVAGLEAQVLGLLRRHPPQRGFIVSSFLPEVVRGLRARARDAAVPLGFITDRAEHLDAWRELGAQVLVAQYQLVTSELVETLHRAGRQVFAWTVNDAVAMRRLAELGVDAVVSDDTELLGRTLGPRR